MKTIKTSTVKRYTGPQLWRAVLRRNEDYRRDAGGSIFVKRKPFEYESEPAGYYYHCKERDRSAAIVALLDMNAITGANGTFLLGVLMDMDY